MPEAPVGILFGPEASFLSPDNAYTRLRATRLQEATRPFLARGHRVARCNRCQLKPCLCAIRPSIQLTCDLLLLMHRNEILKPTNTGRLIADCFPANTWAASWSRTQPSPRLLSLLEDPAYYPLLLFPGEFNPLFSSPPASTYGEDGQGRYCTNNKPRKPLIIIIDGTWKQARRMYLQSPWLHCHPRLELSEFNSGNYGLRQAPGGQHQLATAEAASLALKMLQEDAGSKTLIDYFGIFQQHYLAMRSNHLPKPDPNPQ